MVEILRNVVGRQLGLDKDDSLILGGSKIYYGHNAKLDAVVDLTALGSFSASLTPAALSASHNDYAPTGYVAGATKRLLLTAASGDSTITGLLAAQDGFQILLVNQSTTDSIIFPHLSSSSLAANRFSCASGASVSLAPLAAAYANYVSNVWMFA